MHAKEDTGKTRESFRVEKDVEGNLNVSLLSTGSRCCECVQEGRKVSSVITQPLQHFITRLCRWSLRTELNRNRHMLRNRSRKAQGFPTATLDTKENGVMDTFKILRENNLQFRVLKSVKIASARKEWWHFKTFGGLGIEFKADEIKNKACLSSLKGNIRKEMQS